MEGALRSALELKVPPPVVALILAVAMWFASSYGPALDVPVFVRVASGIVIALLGGVISIAGTVSFRMAKTTVNPMKPEKTSSLVTSGVYRFTRNPMYLGMLLVLVGWAAYLCSPWSLAGPVLFFAYIGRFQIAPEERVLSGMFGEAYVAYCEKVRRWL